MIVSEQKKRILRLPFFFGLIIILILCSSRWAFSQYFGRNKVQYQSFNFKVLETENFNIYYYPEEFKAAEDAGRMLERWNQRLSVVFNHTLNKYQPMVLYANHADFQQTNVVFGMISQGTGGVTEGAKNRIVLPFTGIYSENNHVLGHELTHAFQYEILNSDRSKRGAAREMPLWFIEGMAEYLSLGREYPLTAMWLRDALLNDKLPSIKEVSRNSRYFPYRWGHSIWAYIGSKYGDRTVGTLFKGVAAAGWKQGFQRVIKISPDSLSKEWNAAIKKEYKPQIQNRSKPGDVGKSLLKNEGAISLSPSISPDGRYVAFLSSRDIFTIDLYLANVETGEIVKKLASSNSDAHFDALRFFDSSGSWSPDGSRLAFVVQEAGDNAIAILDVASLEIKKTFKIKEADAIINLAWSPDGRRLAIFGTVGGIGDLFLYDLQTGSQTRLTNDRYSELQPAWSADGKTLVFVTERGADTDFRELKFGAMKIGFMDVESQNIRMVSMPGATKHINPSYSPDGSKLYFVADPDGFSDIYEYSFQTKKFKRMTHIATGVSGLTELSPALTVARQTGRMVFTVFDDTKYRLRLLDPQTEKGVIAGRNPTDEGALLPLASKRDIESGVVDNYLASPQSGLPMSSQFKTHDYHPSLKLISVSQAGIGIAVDRYGTALGGAVSFLFSDLLGNRLLGVAAQVNGGYKDLGGQALYMNQKHRINWGGALGHIPYQTAQVFSVPDTVSVNGQNFLGEKITLIRDRVFIDRIAPMIEYPLSTNRRLEFSTGYTRISYDREAEIYTTVGGTVVDQKNQGLDSPAGLNLFQTSAAYVGDYSFFGFTSPVNGRRYRLEVEPTFGSLRYLTGLLDYRHYFFLNPFTLAFRGYFLGRFLKDSGSNRLTPLFLGYETLVRGYDIGSINASECTQTNDNGQCPEVDRLIGSRIGVFNAEFRIPLFGTEQFGLLNFPYLPTELAAFFDGGVAWSKNDKPDLVFKKRSAKRIPVFSAGVAARVNLLGLIVAQVYYAFPFQRPNKKALFGFVIAPGW